MIFPALGSFPENADAFAAEEFSPSFSDTMTLSVQVDTSAMDNPSTGNFTVMGSNKSIAEADMVAVRDEVGNSGSFAIGVPFVRANFPFQYIGIKYEKNGNAGSGNVTMLVEKKVQRVNIA